MSAIDRQSESSDAAARLALTAFRPAPRTLAVICGYGLLLWAIAVVLFFPNGWLPIALAAGATALLSFDPKLGPMPAALLVMLTMPVGRGSEVGLPRILEDIPIRTHDVVPLVGIVLALPATIRQLARPRTIRWTAAIPFAVFAAVGVLALLIGIVGDQALRDIVRDARWWAFYGAGLVIVLSGTPRAPIIRALVWGLTIYAAVLLIALLMPMFNGGLKYGAYAYDPRLRLHYGQAVFLLVAIAIIVARYVRRPTVSTALLMVLLAAAVGVTLTRTLLAALVGVVVLVAIWAAIQSRPRASSWFAALGFRAVPAVLVALLGIGVGFGVYQFGIQIWTPDWAYSTTSGVSGQPTSSRPVLPSFGRVFDETENSGFGAQAGGRLTSYVVALGATSEAPVVGHGLGQLASVPWAWGGFRAYTQGAQPGVDDAYLTVGLKAGALGIAAFAAMMLWPLREVMPRHLRRLRPWYVPAWLALLGLMLIQSFAVSGYAPFVLAALIALPGLDRVRPDKVAAR